MRYLFFDIECANNFGKVCKMCEFGYVLTDDKFNVLQKCDYPMSPGKKNVRSNRFDLKIYEREPGFQWAYDIDYYYNCEEFPAFYNRIKALVEDENTLVLGHSVDNDLRYLASSAMRYKLAPFKFIAYDTQVMMNYFSEKRQRFMGLKDAFLQLCSKEELIKLQPHLSADDAYMTMRVVERMCTELEVTLPELIDLCEGTKITFENFNLIKEAIVRKYNPRTKDHKNNKQGQVLWGEFYREYLSVLWDESSNGRRVTISAKLKEDVPILEKVIAAIKTKELIAFDGIGRADIFVVKDEKDKERLLKMFQHPFNGTFILLDDFILTEENE